MSRRLAEVSPHLPHQHSTSVHPVLENQFLRLFTAYAMDFNKRYNRAGNLFHRPFRRVSIAGENHFMKMIYYIHANPKKHGVMQDFQKYRWSSYEAHLSNQPTKLDRYAVLEWFCSKENFIAFHQVEQDVSKIESFLLEE